MNPPDLSKVRILIVEDEQFIRNLIARMLRSVGVRTIQEAADGTEALKILDAGFDLDLILCDLRMVPMDGPTFVRLVRASPDPSRSRVPILLLTAASDAASVRAAASLGVDGYLVKPISPKLLSERVTSALERR